MEIEAVSGNSVRIPKPRPGRAALVRRYREERAVILHPRDFRRLADLESLVIELSALETIEPSELARRAHVESDTAGSPTTDPAKLEVLFGA